VGEGDAPLGLGLLGGVELLAPPLGELELLLEELGLLGLLAPPEAEPDFALSLDEDGLDELDEAPPDGDEGELLGEDVLELEEPGPDEALLGLSPRSHAARPRASATATAIAESFMCPPRVGVYKSSKLRARPKPLIA